MFVEESAGDGDVATAEGRDRSMQNIPVSLRLGETTWMALLRKRQAQLRAFARERGRG
jgi:hypothetical protein